MEPITKQAAPRAIRLAILLLALSFCSLLSAAKIKGVVKDDMKNIVPGVTVILKGTNNATITNFNGKFQLQVPDNMKSKEVTLVFKRDGYHPRDKRVTVDNQFKEFRIFFISRDVLLQKVTVTAMNREKKEVSVPMAEHSVTELEIHEKNAENIVETLADTPGVHFIGSGGFSITPTIRGLARRRVLIMVDGHRVTSDRRAGTSAAFVPPELAGRIEVVRSSSSVLYGSDAIGGVINILTRTGGTVDKPAAERNALNFNYNNVNRRVNTGVTFGYNNAKWNIYSGFQYNRGDNYKAPGQTILNSGYIYSSGLLDVAYKDKKREFYLGYIGGFGKDIGKPDRANDPGKYTTVPSESNQFFRFGYSEKELVKNGALELSLFLNPNTYDLSKIDTYKNRKDTSETRALNLGLKTTLIKTLGKTFSYQAGLEWFSRQDVRTSNEINNLSGAAGSVTQPMKDGARNDYSLFFTFDYLGIPGLEIDGGARYTYFSIDAEADGVYREKSTGSYSFFLGVLKRLTDNVSLFVNAGRAFRFPSLGESFYTGLTGRKYVTGNPALLPERSFNIDTGLKITSDNFNMGLYFFAYFIDRMIERFKDESNVYMYDNIDQGNIYGGELEVQYRPVNNVTLFGHYFNYHGRNSGTKDPLNDVPAPRLLFGAKVYIDRLWFEINYLHSFTKSDPGPAEVENSTYDLLDLKGGYYISSTFYFYLKFANILNESYFPNADPDIPLGKGFSLSAGVHVYF
jgi:outer membrane receptor protein involved in Fe transport